MNFQDLFLFNKKNKKNNCQIDQEHMVRSDRLKTKERSSSVSTILKNSMESVIIGEELIQKKIPSEFTIKIANTLEERESAFKLAYDVYLDKGYIEDNETGMLINPYDADPDTVIFIVQDSELNTVGSLTIAFDSNFKLPAESIYCTEIKKLQASKERIVEVSRLVVDPKFRNSKEILVLLFNYQYIYSYFIKRYSCLVIEVNPRHTAYYKALLGFIPIGLEKPCPNVQSAPAVLMYLPLSSLYNEVYQITNMPESNHNRRSLCHSFVRSDQESLVVEYLEKQIKPMTEIELKYFGIVKCEENYVVL